MGKVWAAYWAPFDNKMVFTAWKMMYASRPKDMFLMQ
jgi:hypothetical protein